MIVSRLGETGVEDRSGSLVRHRDVGSTANRTAGADASTFDLIYTLLYLRYPWLSYLYMPPSTP